jgi:digeranylgeranylglycerophospholipid reductase
MTVENDWDAIVIGAGPAGAMAARELAAGGLRTLLLEKDGQIGVPLRCAEAVPAEPFARFVDPDPCFISSPINGGVVVAPDGTTIEKPYPQVGWILERKLFERKIVGKAAQAGAKVMPRTSAIGLVMEKHSAKAVRLQRHDGTVEELSCRLVVGADGVEGMVGRWAGLSRSLSPRHIHSCAQYTCTGYDAREFVHFYVGREVAPGGYAWIFPKGTDLVHIGIGVIPTLTQPGWTAQRYLDQFKDRVAPDAVPLEHHAGGVPAGGTKPARMVRENVALVGDAAGLGDPFSGAGIVLALASGAEAGRAGVAALSGALFDPKPLSRYPAALFKGEGASFGKYQAVQRLFVSLSDREINSTLRIIKKEIETKTMGSFAIITVLLKCLLANPALVAKTRHLIGL